MKKLLLAGACLVVMTTSALAQTCPYAKSINNLVEQGYVANSGPKVTCSEVAEFYRKMIAIGEQLVPLYQKSQDDKSCKPGDGLSVTKSILEEYRQKLKEAQDPACPAKTKALWENKVRQAKTPQEMRAAMYHLSKLQGYSHLSDIDCSRPPRASGETPWWYQCHYELTAIKHLNREQMRAVLRTTMGKENVSMEEVRKQFTHDFEMVLAIKDILDELKVTKNDASGRSSPPPAGSSAGRSGPPPTTKPQVSSGRSDTVTESPSTKPSTKMYHNDTVDPAHNIDCTRPPRATEDLDWYYACHRENNYGKKLTTDQLRKVLRATTKLYTGKRFTWEELREMFPDDLVPQFAIMETQEQLDQDALMKEGQANVQREGERAVAKEEEEIRRAQERPLNSKDSTVTGIPNDRAKESSKVPVDHDSFDKAGTPAKPATFGALSIAVWIDKDGIEQAGVGLVYGHRTQDEADAAAVAKCTSSMNSVHGDGKCMSPPIQFSGGECKYVTLGTFENSAAYGFGGTPEEATQMCKTGRGDGRKFICKQPIGACTQ